MSQFIMKYKNIFLITIMAFSINAFTQSNNDLNELTGGLDSDYLKVYLRM